ncbi:MAG: hypothetical protein E7477_04360 [Ruminococcaceae bacterium]|nr:hypothetical protein [Oscillospiraceae bacterium]
MKKNKKLNSLAKFLVDTIFSEMEKDENEIDMERVAICEILLNTLFPHKKTPPEEIEEKVKKIIERVEAEKEFNKESND